MFHILLIGNNPEVAKLTSKLIKRSGFDTEIILEPQEVPETKPDLLIFDCDLPPFEGMEKYRKILRLYRQSKILWISSDPTEEVGALELGADDWMKKPLNVEVLIARIKKLCKNTLKIC